MSSRTKRTDINDRSRRLTHERNGYRCVYCGRTDKPIELAHYISWAKADAEPVGVETLHPEKLAAMMDDWGDY